jgi:hypothetical protein
MARLIAGTERTRRGPAARRPANGRPTHNSPIAVSAATRVGRPAVMGDGIRPPGRSELAAARGWPDWINSSTVRAGAAPDAGELRAPSVDDVPPGRQRRGGGHGELRRSHPAPTASAAFLKYRRGDAPQNPRSTLDSLAVSITRCVRFPNTTRTGPACVACTLTSVGMPSRQVMSTV